MITTISSIMQVVAEAARLAIATKRSANEAAAASLEEAAAKLRSGEFDITKSIRRAVDQEQAMANARAKLRP